MYTKWFTIPISHGKEITLICSTIMLINTLVFSLTLYIAGGQPNVLHR